VNWDAPVCAIGYDGYSAKCALAGLALVGLADPDLAFDGELLPLLVGSRNFGPTENDPNVEGVLRPPKPSLLNILPNMLPVGERGETDDVMPNPYSPEALFVGELRSPVLVEGRI
jgi:hypothetical protein